MGRPDNIDSVMDSLNEWEKKQSGETESAETQKQNKVFVGTVDQFFTKINVAAVKLVSELNVGDIIEIGNEEEAVRQRISSMQIEREDVEQASEGSDVGIKLKYAVPVGSDVYKIVK